MGHSQHRYTLRLSAKTEWPRSESFCQDARGRPAWLEVVLGKGKDILRDEQTDWANVHGAVPVIFDSLDLNLSATHDCGDGGKVEVFRLQHDSESLVRIPWSSPGLLGAEQVSGRKVSQTVTAGMLSPTVASFLPRSMELSEFQDGP